MAFHQTGPNANASVHTINAVQGSQSNTNIHATNVHYNPSRYLPALAERLNPVSDAAFDSGGIQAAKCMKGTRVDIIGKIKKWVKGDPKDPNFWFHGAAGFGKSAIARTTAEWCADQGILGASFFFLRGSGERSKIARLTPTLAYHLSQSVPATKPFIEKQLKEEPDILLRPAAYQFQKLLVDTFNRTKKKFLSFRKPVAVIIIDALDECDDKILMAEFVGAVIAAGKSWPFRILFTSRIEEHIRQIFQTQAALSVTCSLSLHDFVADEDIRKFYRTVFADIYARNRDVAMRGISSPWPLDEDLNLLIDKTAGVFSFASTVVALVNDGSDLPHLQVIKVLQHHDGLDSVYTYILSVAARNKDFDAVLGALMFLANPLPINSLATLLRLEPARILQALRGLQSILIIPERDDHSIRPMHTSLRDFLTSEERSGNLFIHPIGRHLDIALDCLLLLCISSRDLLFETTHSAQHYACHNWIFHLHGSMKMELLDDSLIPPLIDFVTGNFDQWVNAILGSSVAPRVIYDQIDALARIASPSIVMQIMNQIKAFLRVR